MKKRSIALFMAAIMLFGVAVGGTIAWLTAKTDPVINKFTVGDVKIDLDEADVNKTVDGKEVYTEFVDKDGNTVTTVDEAARVKANVYHMVPGNKYFKDPTVHVLAESEDCYVFVEVIETNNAYNNDRAIQFTVDTTKWTSVETSTEGNVTKTVYMYFKTLAAGESTDSVLKLNNIVTNDEDKIVDADCITINTALTKTYLEGMTADTKPQLDFVAYAVQADNLTVTTPAEIWALAKTATEVTPNT